MTTPYGAWPSPITAASLVEGASAVGEIRSDGDDMWWSESRPSEAGRTVLVRHSVDGTRELFEPFGTGTDWNARTAFSEYGGGAWAVRAGQVVFAHWDDQRLYAAALDAAPSQPPELTQPNPAAPTGAAAGVASPPDLGGSPAPADSRPPDDSQSQSRSVASAQPTPLTPAPTVPREWRYSEPVWLDDDWLLCVRETHTPVVVAEHGEAVTELVAVPTDGSAATNPDRVRVLYSGPDFIHSPAVRGDQVVFLQWEHPRMPWDGTEAVRARVGRDAHGAPELVDVRVVLGSERESVVQPGFVHGGREGAVGAGDAERDSGHRGDGRDGGDGWHGADGAVFAASDRTNWWNLWLVRADGDARPLVTSRDGRPTHDGVDAEMAGPMWVGGLRWWAQLPDGRVAVVVTSEGAQRLAVVDRDGAMTTLDTPFTEISQLVAHGDGLLLVAATPTQAPAPYRVGLDGPGIERLRDPDPAPVGPEWFSAAEHVTFDSADGRVGHALYYAPRNPEVEVPVGEAPPLVVMIHGGPTSAARNRLSLAVQYWTTRGFAVVDVDYGGSTGYGRAYRDLLQGTWGVVDVQDAVAAAAHLGARGAADPRRLVIRGGSAGGFTTLAALCFHDVFAAGCSLYGVADLAALAAETHKFESRYLDGLVGPYPQAADVYAQRSPINHVDGFDAPLLVQQGSEDEVVPPNQAEMIVAALAAKGVPHAYQLFEGEGHGFRRAENIVRALESELWFYRAVFGLDDPDDITPVEGAVGLA